METKICIKCGLNKPLSDFSLRKDTGKYRNECKYCRNLKTKVYHKVNKELIAKRRKGYSEQYYIDNREKLLKQSKEYRNNNIKIVKNKAKLRRIKNKKEISEYNRNYLKNNKEKLKNYQREYQRKRRDNDKVYRVKSNIKRLIRNSFKSKNLLKVNKTLEILGCTFEQFKKYLETQFLPWMTWDNYGLYNGELNHGWDIDHRTPLASATCEADIIRLNHYTNLQPLCSYTNRVIKRAII